ncbi:MAG: DUF6277 family protein [Pseudomonadota bacterium]|nr:DUF6277 family protein [Pseudomonadota bacterium]
MIDPKEILAASSAAQQFGQTSQQAMLAPFLEAIPSMTIASTTNASQIIGGIEQVGTQMLAQMTSIRKSVNEQLFSHQDAQRRQRSYDFKRDMSDLRPTDATGFPEELADQFFAPFRTK